MIDECRGKEQETGKVRVDEKRMILLLLLE
jgi:hypothetical protein